MNQPILLHLRRALVSFFPCRVCCAVCQVGSVRQTCVTISSLFGRDLAQLADRKSTHSYTKHHTIASTRAHEQCNGGLNLVRSSLRHPHRGSLCTVTCKTIRNTRSALLLPMRHNLSRSGANTGASKQTPHAARTFGEECVRRATCRGGRPFWSSSVLRATRMFQVQCTSATNGPSQRSVCGACVRRVITLRSTCSSTSVNGS